MQMSQRRVHEPRSTSPANLQSRSGMRFAHLLFGLATLAILSGSDGRGQQGPLPARLNHSCCLKQTTRPTRTI